jgi:hypothetical protein
MYLLYVELCDFRHVLCNAFIYIVGPLKQIGLGGSGCVGGAAPFPEYTFG